MGKNTPVQYGADGLAKTGADKKPSDPELYKAFKLRCDLTANMQDFLVDVWTEEKLQ